MERVYVIKYIHICICVPSEFCVIMYTCIRRNIQTYIHTYIHICIYIHIYIYIYVTMFMHIYVHTCMHMYSYVTTERDIGVFAAVSWPSPDGNS